MQPNLTLVANAKKVFKKTFKDVEFLRFQPPPFLFLKIQPTMRKFGM